VLLDRDRIFTNLYGRHDWRLEAAKRRGAWNSLECTEGDGEAERRFLSDLAKLLG
jgi:hypothetical protein